MNILLDCGHNLGQGLRQLDKTWKCINSPDWHIYAYEPNPAISDAEMSPEVNNIHRVRAAIWTCDGWASFKQIDSDTTGPLRGGSSSLSHYVTNAEPAARTIVAVRDLSRILGEVVSKFQPDLLVCKMDIECAEFPVLRHLLDKKSIGHIDHLYVETHERFMQDEDAMTTKRLLQDVAAAGVTVHHWA